MKSWITEADVQTWSTVFPEESAKWKSSWKSVSPVTQDFPSSLTEEQKTAAFNIHGFSDYVGGSVAGRLLLTETWKNWIDGEVVLTRRRRRRSFVVHWWNG
jgi:hypothetical protein